MLLRVRRTLLSAAGVLVFLMLAGATYQGAATALERRQFPRPGGLFDIGDRQLHLHCLGDGSPTVVLEAPAAGMSAAWGWVQPELASRTRVCSYDRAGLGWSEAGSRMYEPTAVAEQLHTLLERGGEHGPFVIAGQGLGAAFATLFAARFGGEVAGLVLIDVPPAAADRTAARRTNRLFALSPWLARAGVLRATRLLSNRARGLPEPSAGALRAFLNRPDHLTRASRELARWDDTVAMAQSASLSGDLPVVRVDAAGAERLAFLTDPHEAATVVDAIAGAIGRVPPHR
ncbi:MAG: hypothetical protein A3F70_05460 [Acidobacteria bacterium RIFCSPLOWO2_12_FULL_67_14]|nr:MAG: hypothetical protein A3F70_05460 [Acidobacteria bacterium RIFCSPLOWO2_12_FULL_67_14]